MHCCTVKWNYFWIRIPFWIKFVEYKLKYFLMKLRNKISKVIYFKTDVNNICILFSGKVLQMIIQICVTIKPHRWQYLVHYRLPTPTQCLIRRSSERFSFSLVKINIIFLSFLLSSLLFEWNKIEYGIPISNLETHEMIGSYSFGK